MLRLKENPIEWIKFTAVTGVAGSAFFGVLWSRGGLPVAVPCVAGAIAVLSIIAAIARPLAFRGFYRCGMTVCFHVGQIFGRVLLVLVFFLVATPLGAMLRLLGKDPLQLRRTSGKESFWSPAKTNREFDRMF